MSDARIEKGNECYGCGNKECVCRIHEILSECLNINAGLSYCDSVITSSKEIEVSEIEVLHLFISLGHNFFGHHGKAASEHGTQSVQSVECVAGQGLRGDRFFGYKENYNGQVTFFSWEIYQELCSLFTITDKEPSVFRRNIITRGVNLNTLIGKKFEIQGICFEGASECAPCYWMDQAFCEGTEAALKERGGLRARILTSGVLQLSV